MLTTLVLRAPRDEERSALSRWLAREFPTVELVFGDASSVADIIVDLQSFGQQSFDAWAFDRALDALSERDFSLLIEAGTEDMWEGAAQVLARSQRCVGRRNRESEGAWFDRVLSTHRLLHDLTKPLVIADYAHALDVWQWTLRLDPEACAALQVAALFHDIERLESESEARIEAEALDYQAFKDAHAHAGAELVQTRLRGLGAKKEIVERAAELIANHERTSADYEQRVLGDADALSFFSLNSTGFFDYYGKEHTRRKIRYTLGRLSNEGIRVLGSLRLRADIAEMLDSCNAEMPA